MCEPLIIALGTNYFLAERKCFFHFLRECDTHTYTQRDAHIHTHGRGQAQACLCTVYTHWNCDFKETGEQDRKSFLFFFLSALPSNNSFCLWFCSHGLAERISYKCSCRASVNLEGKGSYFKWEEKKKINTDWLPTLLISWKFSRQHEGGKSCILWHIYFNKR